MLQYLLLCEINFAAFNGISNIFEKRLETPTCGIFFYLSRFQIIWCIQSFLLFFIYFTKYLNIISDDTDTLYNLKCNEQCKNISNQFCNNFKSCWYTPIHDFTTQFLFNVKLENLWGYKWLHRWNKKAYKFPNVFLVFILLIIWDILGLFY